MLLTWTSQLNTSNDNFSFYFMTCFGFFSFPLGKIIWHVIHLGSKHHTGQMLSFIMYFWCTNSSDLKGTERLMLFHQPLRNQLQPLKLPPTFETNFKKMRAWSFFPLVYDNLLKTILLESTGCVCYWSDFYNYLELHEFRRKKNPNNSTMMMHLLSCSKSSSFSLRKTDFIGNRA